MGFYQLYREQVIPATREKVWDFISTPLNLKKITPSYMGFDITSKNLPEKMYEGLIIAYKVSPILGIKLTWVTEITKIIEGEYFIDTQHVGPYDFWHHQHRLTEVPNGILMTDIVSYKPPFGILGDVANYFLIKRQLKEIFDYRYNVIEKEFGAVS